MGACRRKASSGEDPPGASCPRANPQDYRGYSIIPYELATGADCDGCLTVVEHGIWPRSSATRAGAVIDTVPIDRAGLRLMELAGVEICSTHCTVLRALNTFPVVIVIEAFIARNAARALISSGQCISGSMNESRRPCPVSSMNTTLVRALHHLSRENSW